MSKLLEFVLRRRVIVGISALMLIVGGALSWSRLPVDAFPDVTNQQVMILIEAEGLGPLDVEQQITFPIEWVMGGLPDVKRIRSLSKTGLSQVVIVSKTTSIPTSPASSCSNACRRPENSFRPASSPRWAQ
jgi:cobalt-zinc-cadmium resistance protein CzcA